MRMAFIIIIGLILLVLSIILFYALKKEMLKPIEFNVIAGIIIAIGTIFGLFGKYLQDSKSSEKTSTILEKVTDLETKNSQLKIENKKLHEQQLEKSTKIISLQDKLIEQSENHTKEISNISNPIPSNFKLNLEGRFTFTPEAVKEVENFIAINKINSRHLPFVRQKPFPKIDAFKKMMFRIVITIKNGEKKVVIKYDKEMEFGYSSPYKPNTFYMMPFGTEIGFWIDELKLDNVETNYINKTLNDFKRAEFSIEIGPRLPGKMNTDYYRDPDTGRPCLVIIDEIKLYSGEKLFEIDNLKGVGIGYWTGDFSFKDEILPLPE